MNSTLKSLIVSVVLFVLVFWVTGRNGNPWSSALSGDTPLMLYILLFIGFGVTLVWVKTTFFED